MQKSQIAAGVVIVALAVLSIQPAVAEKGGTSILHLTLSVPMTASEIAPDASGAVFADYKTQGGAAKQSLKLSAANLAPDATYLLLATTTENDVPQEVAELTTDANGALNVQVGKKGQGQGQSKGQPLPAGLDPVSGLRTLEISIGGTQTVLAADMTAPDKLQYLIKRSLDNDGEDNDATAALRIKSNGIQDQFRIRAAGLDSSATFFLAINGEIADTLASDDQGGLSITSLPGGAPSVLDITELAILNSGSNSVLSTTLP